MIAREIEANPDSVMKAAERLEMDGLVSLNRDVQLQLSTERGALYPAFQFDAKMRPLSIISEVLIEFGNKDMFATAAWFIFPNGWIGRLVDGIDQSVPPMVVLDDREAFAPLQTS
jgi:hypothetical protein